MPFRRLRRLRLKRFRRIGAGGALLALGLTIGCAGGGGRPSTPASGRAGDDSIVRREGDYLLDPVASYPLTVDRERADAVRTAYRELLLAGDPEPALNRARTLLAADPGFHPAMVLAAQGEVASGLYALAAERLTPVAAELPSYTAAGLLLARAEELLGSLPEAYAAYRATDGALAARRAEEIFPRTLQIVGNRLQEALARSRLDEAETQLVRLRKWAPDEIVTLEGEAAVARAQGDGEAELAAVRRLAGRLPESDDFQERQAELELDYGEVRRGLEILQGLAEEHPGDPRLAELLEIARFRRRLELLPGEVRELARRPELTRGEYAALVYWLVPGVRYGEGGRVVIANDILDHPLREEVARVVNLGLMAVDPVLHRFSPDEPVERADALRSLLLALQDTAEVQVACLGTTPLGTGVVTEAVCRTAARCRLIPDPDDCLPRATVSGGQAVELIHRTLEQL